MNKTTKIVLIFIGSVLVLCICTVISMFITALWAFRTITKVSPQAISENPQVVVRIGAEIADYEIPPEFSSPVSFHSGDMTMIRYTSQDEMSYILISQFPEGTSVNADELLRLLDKSSDDPNNIWYSTDTNILEQKPVTIRGQETILNISDGTSLKGFSYRYATATFRGRNGPALIMIARPVDEWDIQMIEWFISTIH